MTSVVAAVGDVSRRGWRRTAEGALGLLAVAYVVVNLVQGEAFSPLVDGGLLLAVSSGAMVLTASRAVMVRDGEHLAWAMLAVAVGTVFVGNLVWVARYAPLEDPPFPSLADLCWLGFYPAAFAGVGLLLHARVPARSWLLWLDGAIAGFVAAAALTALAFDSVAQGRPPGLFGSIVHFGFPGADVALVALLVGACSLSGWRPDRTLVLLGGALGLFALADVAFLVGEANGVPVPGAVAEVLWTSSLVVIALAAGRPVPARSELPCDRWITVIAPSAFAVIALGVLVVGQTRSIGRLTVLFATATVLVGMVRLAGTLRDVRLLATSRPEARTDDLTGLANRRLFFEHAQAVLQRAPAGRPVGLLLVDLDRFKEVNDSLGHHVGDELLRLAGPRMRAAVREGDLAARVGGDEFAVLLDGAGEAAAAAAARRLQDALTDPFDLEGVPVRIGASIGIALAPDHGRDLATLFKKAEVAMYEAKRTGGGHQVYAADRDHHSRDRLRTIAELRQSIEEGRLVVHYQPKADARTSQVVGVEALVRWDHPEHGLLPPGEFLALAEEAGLMSALTTVVLDTALDDVMVWRDKGLELPVAVNLSTANLLDVGFAAQVVTALHDHRLPPRLLMFEITENTILADPARARDTVTQLRQLGVRISLDDYGTGYSSVAYLRQLPLDELKLDRSFIDELDRDPTVVSFVASARVLAQALGLRLVAEGVESRMTWDRVQRIGCDIVQGFVVSRPVPAEALYRFVTGGSEPG